MLEGPRIDEFQRRRVRPLVEEAFAATQDHGMDHELQLVEQVFSQQRPYEGGAAKDGDVLARFAFQLGDLLRDVLPDDGRIVPLGHSRVVETTNLGTPFI